MSLLNDALRKKNNGRQKSEKNCLIRKKFSGRSANKIKLFRMPVLLSIVAATTAVAWYMVSSLSAEHYTPFDSAVVGPTVQPTTVAATTNQPDIETAIDLDFVKSPSTEQNQAAMPQKLPEPDQQSPEVVKKDPEIRPPVSAALKPNEQISALKRKMIETTQEFPRTTPSPEEKHFFQKALRYHRQGKFSLAIQMYHQVLKVNPDHLDALLNLSSAYIQTKAYSEAHQRLMKLRALDADNPDVLLNLAIVEIGLKRPAEAIKLLDRASKQFDQPIFEFYFHRAAAQSQLNRLEEALASYKKAEELNPGHSSLWFNLGVLSDRLKRYDEAVFYYKKYVYGHKGLTDQEDKDIKARVSALQLYLAQIQN